MAPPPLPKGVAPRSIYAYPNPPPVLFSHTAPCTLRDAKKAKRGEKRTPFQRLREIISKINARSAFASPPEQCVWNPTAAFAVTTPEEGELGGARVWVCEGG